LGSSKPTPLPATISCSAHSISSFVSSTLSPGEKKQSQLQSTASWPGTSTSFTRAKRKVQVDVEIREKIHQSYHNKTGTRAFSPKPAAPATADLSPVTASSSSWKFWPSK